MDTFWFFLIVIVICGIALALAKSGACGNNTCEDCACCCAGTECCCATASLPMFVIGVLALWGGGLAAIAWLVVSLVRA